MTKILTAADILAADDFKTVDVECPEWGGTVRLRCMSAAQRDEWEQDTLATREGKRLDNIRARMVALCAVDALGTPMFTDAAAVADLGKKAAKPVNRLFFAALKLNALTEGDVEELRKN